MIWAIHQSGITSATHFSVCGTHLYTNYITIGECGVGGGGNSDGGVSGSGGGGDVNGDECDGNNIKIVLHQINKTK